MINIREYKYKKINNKLFLGIELEVKGETNLKNNIISLNYYKGENLVKTDDSFIIPYITGEGVICLGHEYPNDCDFDKLEVNLLPGSHEWETSYLDTVEWSFQSYDEASRKLAYKVINKGKDTLQNASLNLVFFNKGELLCGSSIEKENLMTEREYYFEYDVPKEIDFTEVHPYLVLPSTNHLLYKGFFINYRSMREEKEKLLKEIPHKEVEDFDDKTANYNKQIAEEEKNLEQIKKTKQQSTPYIVGTNILKVFLNILRAIPKSVESAFEFLIDFVITYFIVMGHAILTVILIAFVIDQWNNPEFTHLQLILLWLGFATFPYLIVSAIAYIPTFIKVCTQETKYISKKDFISKEDKMKKITESENKLKELQKVRDDFIKNMDKYKQEVEANKEKIAQENLEIDKQNAKNKVKAQEIETSYQKMLNTHPEYTKVINTYDELDFTIVDDALSKGGLNLAEIEDFRIKLRSELEQYQKEQEEKLKQLEREQREEAFRQEMRGKMAQMVQESRNLQYATQSYAEAATRQLNYATQQSYALASAMNNLNNTASKLSDQQAMANVYGEAIYNKYI